MFRSPILPPWFMTPEQALTIRRRAERLDIPVTQLIDHALARLGSEPSTATMRRTLLEQLEWQLEGHPAEDAPYLEKFYMLNEHPFRERRYGHKQETLTIAEFIDDHLVEAAGELMLARR